MKVLVACEYSGRVRDAFIAKGHDAISCDILPTEQPGPHYQGDVMDILHEDWDMMIAHPPCTYICIANAPHYNRARFGDEQVNARRLKQKEAIRFFNVLLYGTPHIHKVAIENPLPLKLLTDVAGKYTQIVHPYYFGHEASKTTCLWLKGLAELTPTKMVGRGEFIKGKGKRTNPKWSHGLPIKNRSKVRSLTFQGVADAMADQWG
jgi:hypothetical protein